MNLKRIIREEIDELEWIKDVQSNQDIAQDIADETYIKDDLLHNPFSSSSFFYFFLSSLFSLFPSFKKYCKEKYGLNNINDIKDIWKRYKEIIKDKVNSINESDGLL
jgi:hypothetical protein